MVSKSAADGQLREGNTNLTGQVIVCYIAQSNRCLFQRENKRRSACEVNIVERRWCAMRLAFASRFISLQKFLITALTQDAIRKCLHSLDFCFWKSDY